MRIIFGSLLLIVSFIGVVFFRHYTGTLISHPFLWYILFIALGLSGFWFISGSFKRATKTLDDTYDLEIEKLKANSETIDMDFDLCEFKSGSYSHQVEDQNISSVKWIAPASMLPLTNEEITEDVNQSYLVYRSTINGSKVKYISHAFPFDSTTLKFYILNHNITLYVDKTDRKKYFFDLKR